MAVLQCVYYQTDDNLVYLHLDGALRQIPNSSTFTNLFGMDIDKNMMNQFASKSEAPFSIGYPLLDGAELYTLPGDPNTQYMSDVFPWATQQTVLRHIVNPTQLRLLGFEDNPTQWGDPASMAVPLSVHSGQNWHLQTFFSGYHILYNHLCHPENPINPFFESWLGNHFNKPTIKSRIISTQHQIDELAGEVAIQTPSFSPIAGVYHNNQIEVTISCATPNAVIYYTTDGSDPLPESSSIYKDPIPLNLTDAKSLKAVAEYPDSIGLSAIEQGSYSFQSFDVAPPTFSPSAGPQQNTEISVVISCITPNVTIYYTSNGEDPTTSSNVYSTPVHLDLSNNNQTLKAIAVHNLYQGTSNVASATFNYEPAQVAIPSFLPTPDTLVLPNVRVAMSCVTPNASIYYTTDGTVPTTASSQYVTPVNLFIAGQTKTIKAIAALSGSLSSDTAEGSYSGKAWTHAWALEDEPNDMIGTANLAPTNVTYVAGKQGNAAQFLGASQLTMVNPNDMKSPVYSVACWVKINTLPASYSPIWIFDAKSGSLSGPTLFVMNDGSIQGETIQSNIDYVRCKTDAGTIETGQWYHFTLVAGSDNVLRLYINGGEISSNYFNGTIDTSKCHLFSVGARRGLRNGLNGLVERLYYINEALTAQEVLKLYRYG